ncbi:hypothetical protein [Nocardioides zhouii]|uniref:hypothetical protein n=1 Tax=Nocardioides zhouii TaxID=1168729 RepID=UPI001A9225D4|nr:hypothetical protein [Nocardioides zhouii]
MLAHQMRDDLAPLVSTTGWFGYGSFTRALQAQSLPDVRMSHHHVWDASRHEAPDDEEPRSNVPGAPDAVARITTELRLPGLASAAWHEIYTTLAAFIAAYEFNLTEATRWSRDQLVQRGVEVNRRAVTVVAQGAAYGGSPLYQKPAPTAAELGEAFVANLLNRASAADIELTPDEVTAVRSWFGI